MNLPAADWSSNFSDHTTTVLKLPYSEFTGQLEKSPADKRQHKLIRLPNNMVVVCTSDSNATTAAASLSVNIGSSVDPPELQGLAHFLEHMLFMGSKKYPDETAYSAYIIQNSGYYNATTTLESTTYYFTVANNALKGALDRLAQFFISPLFSPNAVDREVNSIDSEFKGILNNDPGRVDAIKHELTDPSHPHSNFPTGNNSTLKESANKLGLNLWDEVMKLYHKYYSADIMKLAISGNYPMDTLVEWAVSMLSAVESKGDTRLPAVDSPLTQKVLGKLVHYKRVSDIDELRLHFATPDLQGMHKVRPEHYFQTLIDGNRCGSLLHYLRKNGWATSSNSWEDVFNGYSEFTIALYLTPEGTKSYNKVLHAMFAYLAMLSSAGPTEWFYKELQTMCHLNHLHFKPPDEDAWVDLLSTFRHDPHIAPEHYLIKENMLCEFDSNAIAKFMQSFTPQNCIVFFGTQGSEDVEYTVKEKYHGVPYCVEELAPKLFQPGMSNLQGNHQFSMPKPNRFLPKNLDIVSNPNKHAEIQTAPILLVNSGQYELWFKQDDRFSTPHGSIILKVLLPDGDKLSLLDTAIARVLHKCIYELLNAEFSDAELAGIKFGLPYIDDSIVIWVEGFSDGLAKLMESIINFVQHLQIDDTTFKNGVESAIQSIQHHECDDLYKQLRSFRWDVFLEKGWSNDALTEALHTVNVEMVQDYLSCAFRQGFFKLLVCGNYTESNAMGIANSINNSLQISAMPKSLHKPPRLIDFTPGHYTYRFEAKNKQEVNHAVLSTIFCGLFSDVKEQMAVDVIEQIICNAFFDQLRTQEQLGYVALLYSFNFENGRNSIVTLVQSEQSPMFMSQRITQFMNDIRKDIVNISEDKLGTIIQSLITETSKQSKSITDEADKFWGHISSNNYNFAECKQNIEYLKKLDKKYIVDVWDKYINPDTALEYSRVDMQMWSNAASLPSMDDMVTYSDGIIALHSCLAKSGVNERSLNELHQLLDGKTMEDSGAILNELVSDVEENSKVQAALEMALQPLAVPATSIAEQPGTRRIKDGKYIITDLNQFKAAQRFHDLADPAIPLVPKYEL